MPAVAPASLGYGKVIDGIFSQAGKSTEATLTSLRRTLGDVDPTFDYSIFKRSASHPSLQTQAYAEEDDEETHKYLLGPFLEINRRIRSKDAPRRGIDALRKQSSGAESMRKSASAKELHSRRPSGAAARSSYGFAGPKVGSPAFLGPSRQHVDRISRLGAHSPPPGAYQPRIDVTRDRLIVPDMTIGLPKERTYPKKYERQPGGAVIISKRAPDEALQKTAEAAPGPSYDMFTGQGLGLRPHISTPDLHRMIPRDQALSFDKRQWHESHFLDDPERLMRQHFAVNMRRPVVCDFTKTKYREPMARTTVDAVYSINLDTIRPRGDVGVTDLRRQLKRPPLEAALGRREAGPAVDRSMARDCRIQTHYTEPVNIALAKYTSRPPLNRQILQYQTDDPAVYSAVLARERKQYPDSHLVHPRSHPPPDFKRMTNRAAAYQGTRNAVGLPATSNPLIDPRRNKAVEGVLSTDIAMTNCFDPPLLRPHFQDLRFQKTIARDRRFPRPRGEAVLPVAAGAVTQQPGGQGGFFESSEFMCGYTAGRSKPLDHLFRFQRPLRASESRTKLHVDPRRKKMMASRSARYL
ncbi:unnamed protein product [Vitrella brassicaformis CCMP3155]|uniref:Uncharacterized protein n=1 Tax=Vitrella brassicaformis (strain CCMP3155) TaxID=1169540 RepID=A0A0G4ENG5_VITBC|nr:unnamed protein product [Vitrella brassicaformis CCMP3155]|mmetsp:Transcript_33323/g.82561  ORF Transcript_33323/g.82561 Transcript_33323/m.82561 type:complete len:580 (-) Transcript_33323:938-2677(-)|eukprot:CEL98381.1 unnamed protein product [Vitrella brassicaformis CCMP3155]